MQPRIGSGRLQWNTAGWFGGQIGSTLWLFILGIVFLGKALPLAIILIFCALIPNLVGFWIWRRRDKIAPYPAIQWLVGTAGLCSLGAILGIYFFGFPGESGPRATLLYNYWFILLFPALMVEFYFLERIGRARKPSRGRKRGDSTAGKDR